ncbi:MAG: histone deacetylase, partial [Chloroflexi bacterium]
MATGVFFHQDLVGETWPIIGNKFRNFPRVMQEALSLPEVVLFEPKPVPEEILLKMHHPDYLKRVKRDWYYRGAVLSVGGCVEAGERIAKGELANALVFAVAAGHHCGPSSGWGGTYLSCTG